MGCRTLNGECVQCGGRSVHSKLRHRSFGNVENLVHPDPPPIHPDPPPAKSGFVKGYVMRRGAPFIDAFDRDGKLVMEDGRRLSVVDFTNDDWERLVGRGVAWEGKANLSRFFNEVPEPKGKGAASVAYSKGWWHTTRPVKKGEELLVSNYGSDYGPH